MPRIVKASLVLLALLALYSLLGFVVGPRLALHYLNQTLAERLTQPAHLQALSFNPFTLELRAQGLLIGSAEQPTVAAEGLYANLQLDSLWQRTLHLTDVRLDQPRVDLRIAKGGAVNLAGLWRSDPTAASAAPAPTPEQPSQPFPVHIERIALVGGQLHYLDAQGAQPVEVTFTPLDAQLQDFRTRSSETPGQLALTATTAQGGQLTWKGSLDLEPLRSEGDLTLQGVSLAPWWPYVRNQLPLALAKGRLEASTHYRLDLTKTLQLQLSQGRLALDDIAVQAVGAEPKASFKHFAAEGLALDLQKREVSIARLRGNGLDAWGNREKDGSLDWQKLFPRSDAPSSGPAWRVQLKDVQLSDNQLHLVDRVPPDPASLYFSGLDLALKDFDSQGDKPFGLDLKTTLGDRGRITVAGQLALAPLQGNFAVSIDELNLRQAQPYLSPYLRLEIRGGQLAGRLKVALAAGDPLDLRVSGNAQITQVHLLDTLHQQDFMRWQLLDLQGIAFDLGKRLVIDKIDLEKPYGTLVINQDLSNNFSALLVPQPKTDSKDPAPPMQIRIGGVNIKDGSADFADNSLKPGFATNIQSLEGGIGTLDTAASKPADIHLSGKVDRFAPVEIKGRLDPLDPWQQLDVTAYFRQVELTTLSPYTGKFAGYAVRKGRLDLDLQYRIDDGKLQAQNHVVLDQLELGDRVDSKDAVDLPLRLAVALLKDSHGRIDLRLPVAGNLDDPNFSVMPVVWQTLRNLLSRAVQAPFRMLAGLVGGHEANLDAIDFAPGSSSLSAQARSDLDKLAAALRQRPQLTVEVEGHASAASDGRALAASQLEKDFQTQYFNLLQRRGDKVPADPSQLQVPADMRAPLLEGLYRLRLQAQPPQEWDSLDDATRTARLRQAVLEAWSGNDGLLRSLAQQRASAIKTYLVDTAKLDAQRVYLLDVSTQPKSGESPTAAQLQLGAL
ncbi:DUF748 domain-containing protein [Pseudomonas oryzihabitans]|uniref:DUF748 domain-containing protein n=1 Tax=Pseudomonas oryzihabitans TaxID=47885 RepID=UPI0028659DBE|nr:DUF748 domain-containing protein [Pseudomonas psychrotolerans]MDR6678233.1 uncharacterized protein involved in outer membrane biogenesis [Pseudomonas psychrotolerans]